VCEARTGSCSLLAGRLALAFRLGNENDGDGDAGKKRKQRESDSGSEDEADDDDKNAKDGCCGAISPGVSLDAESEIGV
jgi:hypothetical protein